MKSRNGTGNASSRIARAGRRREHPQRRRRAPSSATGCPTASVHSISRYRARRRERAGRHRAVDDDLAVRRDVAPGRHRLDEQERREREEDDGARRRRRRPVARTHAAPPRVRQPWTIDQRERQRQEDAVVVRRERDAARRAGERACRAAAGRPARAHGPDARHREVGEDDRQRRRDVVLDVVRVAHVQRRDGQEDRRRDRRPMIGQPRAEPVEHGNRRRARGDAERAGRRCRCPSDR